MAAETTTGEEEFEKKVSDDIARIFPRAEDIKQKSKKFLRLGKLRLSI